MKMGSGLCKSDNTSTPGNRRFKGARRATNGEEYKERYAIPEGKYTVKLRGEKHCIINSATYLPTGEVVMSDMINRKLKLFNCNFELVSELEFQSAVQYVSASPNLPLVYAAFPDRIRQVHVDGGELKRSGFIKTPGTCRAICVNKFDGKAISMSLDEETGQVNLLTPGGNLQMELIEDPEGQQLFIRPESIVVTRDLNLIVADKGTQSVLGLQADGEVLFEYTGVRYPTAIVCDERNYIYVAGPNNIHQLSEHGDLIKLFVTKAEIGFSPLSMTYNEEKKHLLVTGKGPRVTLFKLT